MNLGELKDRSIVIHDPLKLNSITITHQTMSYISIAFSTLALTLSSLASFRPLPQYLRDGRSFVHGLVILFSQAFRIFGYIVVASYYSFAMIVVVPIWLSNLYYLNKSGLFKSSPFMLLANSLLNVPLVCLVTKKSNGPRWVTFEFGLLTDKSFLHKYSSMEEVT